MVSVKDFNGHVSNKNVWKKNEIKVVLGSENLLCPNDLLKIGRLGIVDREKEIERIVK